MRRKGGGLLSLYGAAGIAMLALLAGPGAAAAQNAPEPAGGSSWRVECTNTGKTLDCKAIAEVHQRDSRQLVASIVVRYPAETKKPVMMVQLPLGILVTEPVSISVDGAAAEQTKIQTCTQAGCFAGHNVSDALIAAMQKGKQIAIGFFNSNKQKITVTVPLAGFDLVYNKIKS